MTSEAVRLSAENKYNQAAFAADKRSRKAECSARTGDSDSRVKLKTRTFYPRTTFCRPWISRSPLREIFHRVFGITKKYRPTMHPKCAAALADKDGKNLLMFKGRTEVTTHKWEDLHKKRDRRDAVSYCFLHINIRSKPICYVHSASTNHQGQAVHCRINSSGK